MSEFGGFLRESLASSARTQSRILAQQADPRETVEIGSLHADRHYAHALSLSVLRGWVVLDFFDTDREDPLRPQTFAVQKDEWEAILSAARGASNPYKVGRLRKVTASSGSLDTEDAYGSHFSVNLDDKFEKLADKVSAALRKAPPESPAEELAFTLSRLAGGAWPRSHPVVMAVQDRFESSEESARALAPHLNSDNNAVLLFVCALLHEELKKDDSDLLIEPLLKVVETGEGMEREAAEGHLSAFPLLPTPALERLARQIPMRKGDPYSTGSLLRPFLAAKERAGPAVAPLAKVFPTLLERAQQSHRVESQVVVDQALRIFAAVPEMWSTSRGAVAYAVKADWSSARECKAAMLAAMPIPWEQGLVLPRQPEVQATPPSSSMFSSNPVYIEAQDTSFRDSKLRANLVGGGILVLLLCFLYAWTNAPTSYGPKDGEVLKRPGAAALKKRPGYQVGGATVQHRAHGPFIEFKGEPVEGVEEVWSRYRVVEGDLILSGLRSRPGQGNTAQSEVLTFDGKPVLKAGQPLEAWTKHEKRAGEALVQVQSSLVNGKPTILGFVQQVSDFGRPLVPHSSAPEGSAELLKSLADRKPFPAAWSRACSSYPGWKRLRLADGAPLLLRFLEKDSRRHSDVEDDVQKARFLIENGYDLSLTDTAGRSALHLAESDEIVRLLLKKGLGVETADASGRSPLFGAQDDRLALLLKAKANPNRQDKDGVTPLMVAPDPDAVLALLQAGAKADVKDKSGRNALFYQNSLESLVMLIEAGADPEAVDADGTSVANFKQGKNATNFRLARSRARLR